MIDLVSSNYTREYGCMCMYALIFLDFTTTLERRSDSAVTCVFLYV